MLLVGDGVTLLIVTLAGFAKHGTLGTAGSRILTTFIPLLIAWLLYAPLLGAFDPQRAADLRQLWRPLWAMILASPMAAWMRGYWLDAPILPIFVVILGGISALSLLAWRFAYCLVARWKH